MNKIYFLICLLIITAGSFLCVSSPVSGKKNNDTGIQIIKKENHGQTISIKEGGLIQLELVRSGGTGYNWHLDETYKMNFTLQKKTVKENLKKGVVGAPVTEIWQLTAFKTGETSLSALLYRDWEGKAKAAESFHVIIHIR